MNILEIIKESGLKKFISPKSELITKIIDKNNFFVIQMDLDVKQITKIDKLHEKFSGILKTLLNTYNQSGVNSFNNILIRKYLDEMKY